MSNRKILSGFIKDFESIVPFELVIYQDPDCLEWTMYINDNLCDDLGSLDELLETYDVYYETMEDFKEDNMSFISTWLEDNDIL